MAGSHHQHLETYRRKRDFQHTPEPARTPRRRAARAAETAERRFVVHLHHARRRHFDLRLQVGGSLRSWAVPKGPSRDPSIKHLAVQVEDHPLSYAAFEGTIPEGHYGAGTVAIWDEGTWSTDESATRQLEKGHLRFELHGARLRGRWSLIRTGSKSSDKPQWLLIKGEDSYTDRGDVADDTPLSQWKVEHLQKEAAQSGSRKTTRSVRRTKARAAEASQLSPQDFGFQLARLHQRAPSGSNWLHEVKYDGYRMLAWRDHDKLQLLSRNHLDWTDRLPRIVAAVRALECRSCALDGELVVFDHEGHTRFDLLQQEFTRAHADATHYVVFDLLMLDGKDLRDRPLQERKAALSRLLERGHAKRADDVLMLSGFIQGEGALAYKRACEAGLEGVISKAIEAPYATGRNDAWRKLKCIDSDEFVIVGYTAGRGSRGALGALLLAEPREQGWHYVGRVGTGMDAPMLKRVHGMLKVARTAPKLLNPPDAKQLRGVKPVWVKPEHVVEIAYRGRTGDDMLRQGSFKGLRPDKSPGDLRDRDADADEAAPQDSVMPKIALTHPERVLIEKPRVTKQSLADFYVGVADRLLPGIVGRPLSLVRCPDGIGNQCFFQKHGMRGMPEAIRVGTQRNSRGENEEFLYVDGIEGVLGLVQMNVIEIHPWGSTIADIDHPDRLVFDLDPDPGVAWPRVRDAAKRLRERLAAVKLQGFLRTTGGKGLHVVVPLNPRPDWESAKAFSQALARTLEAEWPRDYVSVATKSKRSGRIFVDYLRNARGSTAVTSYCVRAREGAGVATPLHWEELPKLRSGAQYTIKNISRRLQKLQRDPWAGIEEVRQALPQS
ncbi:MAG TPA: DNA ligase D [Rhodanobacteraceae bacterium]|nr:DNA ligase D [Rhodanobacteraceae bacterium]